MNNKKKKEKKKPPVWKCQKTSTAKSHLQSRISSEYRADLLNLRTTCKLKLYTLLGEELAKQL
jgi:hypothetical protein